MPALRVRNGTLRVHEWGSIRSGNDGISAALPPRRGRPRTGSPGATCTMHRKASYRPRVAAFLYPGDSACPLVPARSSPAISPSPSCWGSPFPEWDLRRRRLPPRKVKRARWKPSRSPVRASSGRMSRPHCPSPSSRRRRSKPRASPPPSNCCNSSTSPATARTAWRRMPASHRPTCAATMVCPAPTSAARAPTPRWCC